MKEFYNRLSSFERRVFFFIVILALVIFTLFVVRPMLKQWDEITARRTKAENTLALYEKEIAKASDYKRRITELEGQGAVVPQEEQGTDFAITIQRQAAASQVSVISSVGQQGKTNQFFFEKAQALTINAGETNLVDFLYSLGEGASLIRVRDFSLRPADAARSGLSATLKLVASYQKKTPPKAATNAPAAKPAAASAPKPAVKPPEPAKPAPSPATKPSTSTKK